MWARVVNGIVVEDPINFDPTGCFTDEIVAQFIQIPSGVQVQQGCTYINGIFSAPVITLAQARQAKTIEITQAYQNAVNSTFTSSAVYAGTPLTYNYSAIGKPSAQDIWNDLFKAIDKNLLPSTAFPMPVTLANGTVVNHTLAQLQQIEADIAAWKFPLYQKFQKLVTSTIPSATPIDAVNNITW